MLNLAAEGIGVIMCGILSATPVTPIPVNSLGGYRRRLCRPWIQ